MEDEVLLAMQLEDMLVEMGHVVVNIATRVPEAVKLARDADIDFAVLDINVAGTKSFSVADVLRSRCIPFVFATGYGSAGLKEGYRDAATLQKPYEASDLTEALDRCLASSRI
ncbi:response regulator [Mesorhizobium sp. IMUNJ 23232]|uniref:response regulator n=1 Tax=Mesorhizobium sp. IMUNJ 23232 TaxID=3376064 RepID=UPI003797978E